MSTPRTDKPKRKKHRPIVFEDVGGPFKNAGRVNHVPAPPAPVTPVTPVAPVTPVSPSVTPSCWVGDTLVYYPDRPHRRLDCVLIGDEINIGFGMGTGVVEGIDVAHLGTWRDLWCLNDRWYLTGDHPIWVPNKGWCAPDPHADGVYLDGERKHYVIVDNEGTIEERDYLHTQSEFDALTKHFHELRVGDRYAVGSVVEPMRRGVDCLTSPVRSLVKCEGMFPPWTPLYSLVTTGSGGHQMMCDGLWTYGWADWKVLDFRLLVPEYVDA